MLEVFRPFLRKDLRLSQIPYSGVRVEEVFSSATARLVDLHRLYLFKFQDTMAMHTITSFNMIIYSAHASLQGPPNTRPQRQQDFRLCMSSLMSLGFTTPVKATMIRGNMSLAVSSGLLSIAESKALLAEVLSMHYDTSSDHDSRDGPGMAPLMLDFERSLSVDTLARQYADMAVARE